jgi:MoxR-like ATPase
VFTSVLMADELNRTPPRTQSALLECMSERRVTVDRTTFDLPEPFFVVATQNPLTAAGTYPLPENQLDRFLMRIRLGYPDARHEVDVLALEDGHRAANAVRAVVGRDELLATRAEVDKVTLQRELAAFVVDLANRTRTAGDVLLGVSTRGAQAMHRACRARAVVHGRDYAVPDDVRALLLPVWSHRLTMRSGSQAETLLQEVLAQAPMPE